MTKPTIKRLVDYYPPASDPRVKAYPAPWAALVNWVWSERMVNLIVFLPNGDMKSETSVDFLYGTEDEKALAAHRKAGRWCELAASFAPPLVQPKAEEPKAE